MKKGKYEQITHNYGKAWNEMANNTDIRIFAHRLNNQIIPLEGELTELKKWRKILFFWPFTFFLDRRIGFLQSQINSIRNIRNATIKGLSENEREFFLLY